jgi:uncharacterized repeat protein (TIGR01451 family)
MNHKTRLFGYLLVLAVLAVLLIAIPSAWATPEQIRAAQTVPTRTSEPPPPPPSEPTNPPSSDSSDSGDQPTATPTISAEAPLAPVTATPPGTRAAAAKLLLRKEVAPVSAWPGATLHYTLTLSNQGTAAAQQIVLLDPLPADLVPGSIAAGTAAQWEGQVLRVQAETLAPNSRLVLVFTADVRANTRPGSVISNRASATADGNLRATASASVALPPAELPPTGGSLNEVSYTGAAWR